MIGTAISLENKSMCFIMDANIRMPKEKSIHFPHVEERRAGSSSFAMNGLVLFPLDIEFLMHRWSQQLLYTKKDNVAFECLITASQVDRRF